LGSNDTMTEYTLDDFVANDNKKQTELLRLIVRRNDVSDIVVRQIDLTQEDIEKIRHFAERINLIASELKIGTKKVYHD
jgi:hypothetical protein